MSYTAANEDKGDTFLLKGMNPDSYLSGHDLSCMALKVQAVEREVSLEGLSYQS